MHNPTKWAERKDKLYITLQVSSAQNVDIKFTDKKIIVTGQGITQRSCEPHKIDDEITLLKEIVPEKSTFKVLGVSIQVCAVKKDDGYWNKLVDQPTSATKNWLSVDWNLWKDEDEADDVPAGFGDYGNLSDMMNMGGMGMDDEDSDDEDGDLNDPPADLKDLE
ncbi:CS domain [Trypanosoma vivax]|uniref:CS domain-containing protein n=1 Tax=Trypanosoma vivax (strain Y486) TaxID=1055687 RepID=G0U2X8_TRYVY|nr:hypothetical protein TRVL_00888 [Trypanosoma vivax]KAH8604120.1 CS domain [Trypanosoma vivax]CCC50632.1 conserved hypothetical protein [Trypanosoma vivax Y486]